MSKEERQGDFSWDLRLEMRGEQSRQTPTEQEGSPCRRAQTYRIKEFTQMAISIRNSNLQYASANVTSCTVFGHFLPLQQLVGFFIVTVFFAYIEINLMQSHRCLQLCLVANESHKPYDVFYSCHPLTSYSNKA